MTLSRLTEAHLELVRGWRNDPDISQFMAYREHITAQMQREWFARIDNDDNFFFLVEHEGQFAGLIDAKNVSRAERRCDSGAFYQKQYWNSLVPYQGSFTCLDFIFRELGLETVHARVLATNPRAIRFNLGLGYVLDPHQEGVENQAYTLTRDAYQRKTARLQDVVAREGTR